MKTISIEQLAEKLNGRMWVKGNIKRIYLDRGYNTKKMSTETYVYETNARFFAKCTIECPTQNDSWISSQEKEIIQSLNNSIEEIIQEFGFEIIDPMIGIEAQLAAEPQVQGYYMRWADVRIPINSYGKLAVRKRQSVITYKGAISKTPSGFVELNDDHFAQALKMESNEKYFGFNEKPNFINTLEVESAGKRQAEIDEENRKKAQKETEEKKKAYAVELNNKIEVLKANGIASPLLAWKELGFPHPAPAEIVELKNASGLNWKKFTETIN